MSSKRHSRAFQSAFLAVDKIGMQWYAPEIKEQPKQWILPCHHAWKKPKMSYRAGMDEHRFLVSKSCNRPQLLREGQKNPWALLCWIIELTWPQIAENLNKCPIWRYKLFSTKKMDKLTLPPFSPPSWSNKGMTCCPILPALRIWTCTNFRFSKLENITCRTTNVSLMKRSLQPESPTLLTSRKCIFRLLTRLEYSLVKCTDLKRDNHKTKPTIQKF